MRWKFTFQFSMDSKKINMFMKAFIILSFSKFVSASVVHIESDQCDVVREKVVTELFKVCKLNEVAKCLVIKILFTDKENNYYRSFIEEFKYQLQMFD